MKCPACNYIASNKKDICPRCLVDLRPHKAALGLPVIYPNVSADELRAMTSLAEFPIATTAVESIVEPAPSVQPSSTTIVTEFKAEPEKSEPRFGGLLKRFFKPPAPQLEPVSVSPTPEPETPQPADLRESAALHTVPELPAEASNSPTAVAEHVWKAQSAPTVAPAVLEFHDDEQLLDEQLAALLGDNSEEITIEAVPTAQKKTTVASFTADLDDLLDFDDLIEETEDEDDDSDIANPSTHDASLATEAKAEIESAAASDLEIESGSENFDFEVEIEPSAVSDPPETDFAESSLDSIQKAIALVEEATESTEILADVLSTTVADSPESEWLTERAIRLVEELAMECSIPVVELRESLRQLIFPEVSKATDIAATTPQTSSEQASSEVEASLPPEPLADLLNAALDSVLDQSAVEDISQQPERAKVQLAPANLWQDLELEISNLQHFDPTIDLGELVSLANDKKRIDVLFQLTADELDGRTATRDYVEREIKSEERQVDAVALTRAIEKIQQEVEALDGNWEEEQPSATIEPEEWNFPVELLSPPPIGRRIAAKLIDLSLVISLTAGYCFWNLKNSEYQAVVELLTANQPREVSQILSAGVAINFILDALVASIVTTSAFTFTSGQTWGKKLLHITVLSKDGAPLTLWQSLIRALAGPLHLTTMGLSAAGLLWGKRRTLADYMADSQAVTFQENESGNQ